MNYWIEPPRPMTLLCVFVMLPPSLFRATHIHGTDPAGKDCKHTPVERKVLHHHITSIYSNPMLGETFEESRMKFIAEKVQHQPLEIAYHAEGNGWELTATSCGKTKFWGWNLS